MDTLLGASTTCWCSGLLALAVLAPVGILLALISRLATIPGAVLAILGVLLVGIGDAVLVGGLLLVPIGARLPLARMVESFDAAIVAVLGIAEGLVVADGIAGPVGRGVRADGMVDVAMGIDIVD